MTSNAGPRALAERAVARKRAIAIPPAPTGSRWIPLTQGRFALVDEDMYETLSKHSWQYVPAYLGYTAYARRYVSTAEGRKPLYMHAVVLGVAFADHRDGNGLNNRRPNLREVTATQNAQNLAKRRADSRTGAPTSRYKGVSSRGAGKWRARATLNGKAVSLGDFPSEDDAARAYDDFARKHFGEFARLNFPTEERR